jgi:hypothetical protein
MDLSKYLAMLSTETLWFSRADLLGDPFEGSVSRATVAARTAMLKQLGPGVDTQLIASRFSDTARKMVRYHFISCWNLGEWDSAAMWRLYVQGHGVALMSNYARMRSAVDGEEEIFVGLVRYIDYDTDVIPQGNMFWPFMHKQRNFQHESEVRAVMLRVPMRDSAPDWLQAQPPGIAVPTDLRALVEEVRVSPDTPAWFSDVVKSVTERYSFEFPVRRSSLGVDPVY